MQMGTKRGKADTSHLIYYIIFGTKRKAFSFIINGERKILSSGMENMVDFAPLKWYDRGGEGGGHPSQKTLFTAIRDKRGVSVMQKTIAVVDEMGNQYEATYPRRARGLVKKGRARFIAEDCICLVRPPETIEKTEDSHMSMTVDKILDKMTEILASNQQVEAALATLQNMEVVQIGKDPYAPPDVAGEARAKAISQIVTSQMDINRQMLTFLERMYDDLREDMKAAQSAADNQR